VNISNKKISYFPSLNQYFPHIPYVASKNSGFVESQILNYLGKRIFTISLLLHGVSTHFDGSVPKIKSA
jgi:hypothetical protein